MTGGNWGGVIQVDSKVSWERERMNSGSVTEIEMGEKKQWERIGKGGQEKGRHWSTVQVKGKDRGEKRTFGIFKI